MVCQTFQTSSNFTEHHFNRRLNFYSSLTSATSLKFKISTRRPVERSATLLFFSNLTEKAWECILNATEPSQMSDMTSHTQKKTRFPPSLKRYRRYNETQLKRTPFCFYSCLYFISPCSPVFMITRQFPLIQVIRLSWKSYPRLFHNYTLPLIQISSQASKTPVTGS